MRALTVREAMRIIDAGPTDRDPALPNLVVSLATSFTPLHLENLLHAYVQLRMADRVVRMETASYGDLANGIDELGLVAATVCAVVIEWQDLDPRLGRRESVTAALAESEEIVANARARLARIESSLQRAGTRCRTVVSVPTLSLPPVYAAAGGRVAGLQASLDLVLAQFVVWCQGLPGVVVMRAGRGADSPYDARTDTSAGHPYSGEHDSRVAGSLASVLFPSPAKKGLITDLDDTLWRGLVGEVGPGAVTWNLDDGSHLHAQYQQLLVALAKRGVLIAIASKNDSGVVGRALARPDLVVRPEHYFPVVANWGPKSASIADILKTWNIGASDVVFVDDSAMEIAEVQGAHPDITGRVFPTSSASDLAVLLEELNELFWSDGTTDEDSLRLASLRDAVLVEDARQASKTPEAFIASLEGSLSINLTDAWAEERSLALVNKTNQFNLNGQRFSMSEWHQKCRSLGAVNIAASYEDRFGRLGVISILNGNIRDEGLFVNTWVLSCRAFSRGIEQRLLDWLLREYGAVEFKYVPTEKNGPTADFLSSTGIDLTKPRMCMCEDGRMDPGTEMAFPRIVLERGESD